MNSGSKPQNIATPYDSKKLWGESESTHLTDALQTIQQADAHDKLNLARKKFKHFEQYAIETSAARDQDEITKKPLANISRVKQRYSPENIAQIFILAIYDIRYLIAIINNKALRETVEEECISATPSTAYTYCRDAYNLLCTAYNLEPGKLSAGITSINKIRNADSRKDAEHNLFRALMHNALTNTPSSIKQKYSIFLELYNHYDREEAFILCEKLSRRREKKSITTALSVFPPNFHSEENANLLLQTELIDPAFFEVMDFALLRNAIRKINTPLNLQVSNVKLEASQAATRAIVYAFQDKNTGFTLAKLCIDTPHIRNKLGTKELKEFAKYNASLAFDIIDRQLLNIYIESKDVAEMVCSHPNSAALVDRAFKKPWFAKSYEFTDAQLVNMTMASSLARDKILKDRDLCFKIIAQATPEQLKNLKKTNPEFLIAIFNKASTSHFWQTDYTRLLIIYQTQKNHFLNQEAVEHALNYLSSLKTKYDRLPKNLKKNIALSVTPILEHAKKYNIDTTTFELNNLKLILEANNHSSLSQQAKPNMPSIAEEEKPQQQSNQEPKDAQPNDLLKAKHDQVRSLPRNLKASTTRTQQLSPAQIQRTAVNIAHHSEETSYHNMMKRLMKHQKAQTHYPSYSAAVRLYAPKPAKDNKPITLHARRLQKNVEKPMAANRHKLGR